MSNSWNNNYIVFESNSDANKNLSLGEYHNKIKSHLRDMIIGLQEFDTGKNQLTIAINFICSKDAEEEHLMHSKGDNIKFNDANKVVDKLFESLCLRYQDNL